MRFHNKKLKVLVTGIISYIIVYLSVKYLLPLFLPFVAAYILAWCIRPVAKMFSKRLKMKNGLAAFLSLVFVLVLIITFLCWTGVEAAGRMSSLIRIWNYCSKDMVTEVKHTCSYIEESVGMEDGTIYEGIAKYADGLNIELITSKVMGKSFRAAVTSVECIVALFVVVVAAFYFLKDRDILAEKRACSTFGKEINRIMGSVYATGLAYAKTQSIIMIITAIVCFAGFKLAGIKYALLYAVAVGIMDALPLLGTGVLLMPAAIIYALRREFVTSAVIVVVFVICYCIREILEPRIMGKNVGLSPIQTMMTMYVGYQLFGITGVITGPFSYIAANELTNILIKCLGEGLHEEIKNSET